MRYDMNYDGILIAMITYVIIGIFHPIVIKAEYYFSKRIWPLFAVSGVLFIGLSLATGSTLVGTALAVFGASALWSIKELFAQEKRVAKGWFPKNPNRKNEPSRDSCNKERGSL